MNPVRGPGRDAAPPNSTAEEFSQTGSNPPADKRHGAGPAGFAALPLVDRQAVASRREALGSGTKTRARSRLFFACGALVVFVIACVSASTTTAIDPRFVALHNAFSAMGLAEVGPVQQGSLVEGREARLPIQLQAQCTTVVAMGGTGVRDIDLVVEDEAGNALGHDVTHDSQAVVRVCVEHAGTYTMLVRMAAGSGDFLAATWVGNAGGAAPSPSSSAALALGPGRGTCASPIPIVSGVYTGNTQHGESENECTTDSPGCSAASDGKELVYRLDVPSQKRLRIELDAHYDAILYVRKDDCASQDAEVKCNDDDNGNQNRSRIDTVLDPGTYYVFVDSFSRAQGSFRMSVALDDVPQLADVCRGARPLSAGTVVNGTTHGAFDLAQGSCAGGTPGPDVPYRLDVGQKMRVRLTMESSSFVPNVYVRRTCTDDRSEIACFDQSSGMQQNSQAVYVGILDPGSYTAFADSSQENADGPFTLQAELAPEGGNGGTGDGCGDAIPLTTSTTASGDTFDVKDDISGRCTAPGAPDVVYRIDLQHRSRIRASFENEEGKSGHQRGHVLVLQKTCADRSSELACAESVDQVLVPGTYYLAVDGATPSSFGKFELRYDVQDVSAQEASCRSAPMIASGQTVSGNTKGAANRFETSCGGDARYGTSGDRIYRIVVAHRSTVTLLLTTPTWDGVLALRRACLDPTGSSGPHAAEVACNNDSDDSHHSRIVTVVDPGTYYVLVDGYRSTEGAFTLQYTATR
jgi:hypothetical protein